MSNVLSIVLNGCVLMCILGMIDIALFDFSGLSVILALIYVIFEIHYGD